MLIVSWLILRKEKQMNARQAILYLKTVTSLLLSYSKDRFC